jgi:sugar (pentulose or hexulose) kinase
VSVAGELVLGVDASTTACKVMAFAADGSVVSEGRAPIELSNPSPGAWEQDADAWWRAFCFASRACVEGLEPERLRGLAIAHQRETFVVTDGQGRPLAPALVWMDHRCGEDVRFVKDRFGAARFHEVTGKPPCTTPSVFKWMGQTRRDRDLASRVAKVLDVQAFLAWRLVERPVTSRASADPLGLVDMRTGEWAHDVLALAGLERHQMAELTDVGETLGSVTSEASAATGLPVGLPLFGGAGDGQAAGLGAGITAPGRAYLNLGTAVVSGVLSTSYAYDSAFRTLFGAVPGTYFLETDLQGGTFTVTWLCERLFGKTLDILPELEAAADAVAPGSEGLFVVPYWNGVMNPYWDEGASGMVVGLRGEHGQGHLFRALLEGIAFEQRLHASGVEAVTSRIDEFVVMGGGSSSDLWCRILADVLDRPMVRAASREATALGAAMIAAGASGVHADVGAAARAMSRRGERFVPGPNRDAYAALYETTYRKIYPALRPVLARR